MYTNGNADMSYVETNTKSPLYKHVAKTYAWMFLGLLLTFLTCVAPVSYTHLDVYKRQSPGRMTEAAV